MRFRIALSLFIYLSIVNLFAQVPDGTWGAGYIRSLDKIFSVDDPSDTNSTYVEFRAVNGILDIRNNMVLSHSFNLGRSKHKIVDSSFRLNDVELRIRSINDDSLVLDIEEEVYMVLFPHESQNARIRKAEFSTGLWRLDIPHSYLDSTQFHFSDSSGLVIRNSRGQGGFIDFGEYWVHKSKNYYVLEILDRESIKHYVFHVNSRVHDEISTTLSESNFPEKPSIQKAILSEIELPDSETLMHTKNLLVGEWEFDELYDKQGYFYSEILKLKINKLVISFQMDNSYLMNSESRSFGLVEEVEYSNSQEGIWQLSQTGNYLTMEYDTGESYKTIDYFSIYEISDDFLVLDMNFEYAERSFTKNIRIRFKKNESGSK